MSNPIPSLYILQRRSQEWRENSFPPEHRTAPLQALGVCEEAGELAHAVLKLEQGIRGTREHHIMTAADAVGDIIIYLAGVCSALELDLENCVADAWHEVSQRDWSKNKETGVSE